MPRKYQKKSLGMVTRSNIKAIALKPTPFVDTYKNNALSVQVPFTKEDNTANKKSKANCKGNSNNKMTSLKKKIENEKKKETQIETEKEREKVIINMDKFIKKQIKKASNISSLYFNQPCGYAANIIACSFCNTINHFCQRK